MSDRFHSCLPFVLEQECPFPNDWSNRKNYSNDVHDPGGATFCGIIQREYDAYRKRKGYPVRDVRELTQIEGEDIYFHSYWLPHCPMFPAGCDLVFFDDSVNQGSFEAIKVMQHALGVVSDGVWGPSTMNAVSGISDPVVFIHAFTARREAVYRSLKGFKYFGKDWIRRSEEICDHALAMVDH